MSPSNSSAITANAVNYDVDAVYTDISKAFDRVHHILFNSDISNIFVQLVM